MVWRNIYIPTDLGGAMVRIASWILIILLIFSNQAFAITHVNVEAIKEAQDYGKSKLQSNYNDFLRPWMAYEEKAERLNETAEHAYLYTPFLLVATDTRDKIARRQQPSIADSQKVLDSYAGYLVFSVTIFGAESNFAENATAVLNQSNKIVRAHQAKILAASKTCWYPKSPLFRAQSYFYFSEKEIRPDRPVILTITTSDKQKHNFYFNLPKIR